MPVAFRNKQKTDAMFIPIKTPSSNSYGRVLPCHQSLQTGFPPESSKSLAGPAVPEKREDTPLFFPDYDDGEEAFFSNGLLHLQAFASGPSSTSDPDVNARKELLSRLPPPAGARSRLCRVSMCTVIETMSAKLFDFVYGCPDDGLEIYSAAAAAGHRAVVLINPEVGWPLTDLWSANSGAHSHLYLPLQQARVVSTVCKRLRDFHLFVKRPPPQPGFTDSVYMGVYSVADTDVGMSAIGWNRTLSEELRYKLVQRDIKYSSIIPAQNAISYGPSDQADIRKRYDGGLSALALLLFQNVHWDQALAEKLQTNGSRVAIAVSRGNEGAITMLPESHAAQFAPRKRRIPKP